MYLMFLLGARIDMTFLISVNLLEIVNIGKMKTNIHTRSASPSQYALARLSNPTI
jgi:hypothetical protein